MPLATPDPRRRLFVQGAMLGTLRLVAAFNVSLLVAICLFLLVQGLPALSWEFLSTPPREMMTAGGILPCIVGTAILALGSLLLACGWFFTRKSKHSCVLSVPHHSGQIPPNRRTRVHNAGCGGFACMPRTAAGARGVSHKKRRNVCSIFGAAVT